METEKVKVHRIIVAKVIKELKKKQLTENEFIKIIQSVKHYHKQDSLRKASARLKEELKEYGLIKIIKKKICWYYYPNTYESMEIFEVKMQHFRQLKKGFQQLIGATYLPNNIDAAISPYSPSYPPPQRVGLQPIDFLSSCAVEHLKCVEYEYICTNYEDLIKKTSKVNALNKKIRKTVQKSITEEFKNIEPIRSKKPNSVNENLTQVIIGKLIESPSWGSTDLSQLGEYIHIDQGGFRIAKGIDLMPQLDSFIKKQLADKTNLELSKELNQENKEKNRLSKTFVEEIQKIVLKIESYQPLFGSCELCPDVHIILKKE